MNIPFESTHVKNIYDFLEILDSYGDDIAIIDKAGNLWRENTFAQLVNDVTHLSASLISRHIKRTHIVLLGENSYEWMITYLGIILSGNVAIPLDNELSDREIIYLIKHSESKIVFYSNTFFDLMKQNRAELEVVDCFVNFKQKMPKSKPSDFISFEEIIMRDRTVGSYKDNYIPLSESEAAVIVFTSGTTGVAKGVMLSEKNVFCVSNRTNEYLHGGKLVFSVLPFYHTYGAMCALFLLRAQLTIALNDKVKNFMQNMVTLKPYNLLVVPIYMEKLYATAMKILKEQNKLDTVRKLIKFSNLLLKIKIDLRKILFKKIRNSLGGNLRLVICGGAPLAAEYIVFFRDIGIYLLQGYGITECSPLVSLNPFFSIRDGSVGKPMGYNQVSIGLEGEIMVKGDNVMLGYYKDPEKTRDAICDDWFKTGDIGMIDEDGYLYITGRLKNMILLSNGKNVYPEEIEERVRLHDQIDDAVVYCPDNDIITLQYYSSEGDINDIDLFISKVNQDLPIYAQIGKVIARDTPFPKTTSQKIKRALVT